MALWELSTAPGGVFGTTWGHRASRELARFDGTATQTAEYLDSDLLDRAFACGPSFAGGRLLCAVDSGQIIDPLAPKNHGQIGRFTPHRPLTMAQAVHGRLCGTRDAVYVLATIE